MPFIPETTIDEIRSRCSIVELIESYTPLKRRGKDYWGCCPFHKEKTPSFKVSVEYQSYYCFGCQKSGNVFKFVMERENADFIGAVRLLARRVGVLIPEEQQAAKSSKNAKRGAADRETLFEVNKRIAEWYQQCLLQEAGKNARDYLEKRNLDEPYIRKFGLGFAPDAWDAALQWGKRHGYNEKAMIAAGLAVEKEDGSKRRVYDRFRGRLMFPIWDELGRVIGFSARVLDPEAKTAKYVNTPETSIFHKGKLLYALHMARPAFKEHGYALVAEGQLDTIACHRAGLNNAVAPQGTSFTEMHARIIKRFTDLVVFAFDADSAGQKAVVRSLEVAAEANLEAKVVIMPEGSDPDSIFQASGAEALQKTITQTEGAFEFLLRVAKEGNEDTSPHGKQAIAEQVLDVVAKLNQPVARAAHCQWLGKQLGLPEDAVYQTLNAIIKRNQRGLRHHNNERSQVQKKPQPGQSDKRLDPAGNTLNEKLDSAKLMLLDLAIHNGPIAHSLAEHEHLDPEQLNQTTLDKALNFVLRKTIDDDWKNAGPALASRTDLISDPRVARILADSPFRRPDLDTEDDTQCHKREQKFEKIFTDCLLVLETAQLDSEIDDVQAILIDAGTSEEKRRELLGRYQSLIQRKALLKSNS